MSISLLIDLSRINLLREQHGSCQDSRRALDEDKAVMIEHLDWMHEGHLFCLSVAGACKAMSNRLVIRNNCHLDNVFDGKQEMLLAPFRARMHRSLGTSFEVSPVYGIMPSNGMGVIHATPIIIEQETCLTWEVLFLVDCHTHPSIDGMTVSWCSKLFEEQPLTN